MSETMDTGAACERIGSMWLRLAEQIEGALPDIIIEGKPEMAIRWGRCAEACFWQATGEADANDIKDVLAANTGASDADQ